MKVVFADRDGTLIVPPPDRRVDRVEKLRLFPDTLDGLGHLAMHDFSIIMVTNQSGIAEGRFSEEEYLQVHHRLLEMLEPSGVRILKTYTCPHSRGDNCVCRKPKPSMILEAAKEFDIDLASTYMVGDRRDDIEVGINSGTKTILVETGSFPVATDGATFVAPDLLTAAKYIVTH
jgi:histidinol-phosphate phosphatase family protein